MKKHLLCWLLIPIAGIAQDCPADAGPDKTVCSPSSGYQGLMIGTTPASGLSYTWSPSTGLATPNYGLTYASPATTTTYTLTVSGYGCTTATSQVTVKVAAPTAVMTVENIDGSNVYYQYEGTEHLNFHSNSTYGNHWYSALTGDLLGSDTSYTRSFTGANTVYESFYLYLLDDNLNSCAYTTVCYVTTIGCFHDADYPVGITHSYYTYGSCGPTLPATITQPYAGTGGSYEWFLTGANDAYWSISSPSGNSATLNNSGGTPYVGETIYTRSLDPYSSTDTRMSWGIGKITNSNCTLALKPHPSTGSATIENIVLGKTILFPNPSRTQVTLSSINTISQVQVFSASGVLSKDLATKQGRTVTFGTGGLKPGLYSCKVFTDKGIEILKLIVQ